MARFLATVRGLLAIGLLVGFYVLAAALVVGYLGLVVLMLHGMTLPTTNPSRNFHLPIMVAAGAIPVLLGVVRGVLATNTPHRTETGTVAVTRAQAPLLWQTVEELAERAGAPMPDEIRLTGEANAAVSEDTRMLGLVVGERRMYLGMPLLVGLPMDELKAILSHELGHYAGRHNRFGAVVYRGALALDTAQEEMRRAASGNALINVYTLLIFGVIRFYAWCYGRIAFAILRRQETEADRSAALIAGPEVTGEALRSTLVLISAWADFRTRFLTPLAAGNSVPDDPFSAFEAMLADPDYRDVLAQHRAAPPETTQARLDTHPSLAQRLAYLATLPTREGPRDLRPALSLLGADPTECAHRVRAALHPAQRELPWRDWVALAAGSHVERHLGWLRPAVRDLREEPPDAELTIDGVLELLETGRTAELAGRLARHAGADPDRGPDLLRAALVSLLGAALVNAGSASWTAPWAGGPRLIVRDPAIELTDLVQRALDNPRDVPRLRLHLAVLGVDSRRPRPAPASARGTTELRLGLADPEIKAASRRSRNLSLWTVGTVGVAVLLALFVFREEPRPYRPPITNILPFTSLLRPGPLYPTPVLPTVRLPIPTIVLPTIRINPSDLRPVTPRRTGN